VDSDTRTDQALVAQYLARRDEAAFLAIYRRHTAALLGLATRLCGGERRDAEDIVQEAWVRAAGGLTSFRWQSSLRTWLSGIVVNGWKELLRSRYREAWLGEENEAALPVAAPEEGLDLERAVALLPHGFRTVLLLHDVEGFTHEEIAGLLEIDPGTSKSQLARARQAMRRRLCGTGKGDRNERIG
jgi:RNA polymerase sigma-70 factor (ECF subfamily)